MRLRQRDPQLKRLPRTEAAVKQLSERSPAPFTTRDFEGISGLPPARSRQLLFRLLQGGKVVRIDRGLYRLPTVPGEAITFALRLAAACAGEIHFISFRSALELHGLLAARPRILQVATASTRDPREIGGNRVEFIRVAPRFLHGFAPTGLGGVGVVPMATPERALIEAFRRPDLVGGFEEAVKALAASRGRVAPGTIIGSLGAREHRFEGATVRRLGFLLQLGALATGEQLAPLRAGLSASYERLNPLEWDGSRYGKDNYHWSREWRVCENADVERLRRILAG